MKFVDQVEYRRDLGDCMRACLASVFEFPILLMPNFWEETQDPRVFWRKVNDWLSKNFGYKCITTTVMDDHRYLIDGVTCVALGKSSRGGEDHAVLWKDGLIHDPHKSKRGLVDTPDTFTFFVPVDPKGRS